MKKQHKKIFIKTFAVISILAIISSINTVNAKDQNNQGSNNWFEDLIDPVSKEQCDATTTAVDRYYPEVKAENIENNIYTVSIKTEGITNKPSGVFDIFIYEIKVNDAGGEYPELKNSLVLGENNVSSQQVYLQSSIVPRHYEIVFSLKKADKVCGVSENVTPVRKSNGTWTLGQGQIGYVYAYQVDVAANITDLKIYNTNYNGICASFRNKNYAAAETEYKAVALTENDFNAYINRNEVQMGLPYCFNEYVEANLKKTDVAMLIKNLIKNTQRKDNIGNNQNYIEPSPDAIEVTEDNPSLNLTCPAYVNVNGSTIPNKNTTVKKYQKTKITPFKESIYASNDVYNGTTLVSETIDFQCDTKCTEEVTVTYGPPVATKAGLCFEYKVKVESKLSCESYPVVEPPSPNDYKVCTPTGSCNGGTHKSASGPNTAFDSCVKECDGGKYSQKCIDTCYKKVYETNGNLKLKYNDKISATQQVYYEDDISKTKVKDENPCDPSKQGYCSKVNSGQCPRDAEAVLTCATSSNVGSGKTFSISELRNALAEANKGYYKVTGGQISWVAGPRYWEKPGRYFSEILTDYTVGRLKPAGRANSSWGGQDGLSVIDTGFLRNNYGTSVCMAACTWSGCSDARNNGYYVGVSNYTPGNGRPQNATNRQFLNTADAMDVYEYENERYTQAVAKCEALSKCTTQTSYFTISVDNKTKDEETNIIEYKDNISENGNLTGTSVNGKGISGTSIILDKSGCYDPETSNGNAEYLTEWSFPGTWMNNKTGNISYQPISGNAWHLKKEKFCTNINSIYVNDEWWQHRMRKSTEDFPEAAQAAIEDYNILATARDFGYFKWDFDIKCFYALSDICIGPKCDGTQDDQPCVGEECNDAKPLSYIARTVDLNDLFPNNDNESITENPNETGRNQGYNWTDAASNVKNGDYEITPGALYPVIQQRGSSIYDADKNNEYLDYEFYLTPADLNTIRRYSEYEGNSKYNSYPGKVEVVNGVAVYESALFRASSTSSYKLDSDSIITLGALGVNNQKRKGSNEKEVFTNTYTAALLQSRNDYLESLSGGNTSE